MIPKMFIALQEVSIFLFSKYEAMFQPIYFSVQMDYVHTIVAVKLLSFV